MSKVKINDWGILSFFPRNLMPLETSSLLKQQWFMLNPKQCHISSHKNVWTCCLRVSLHADADYCKQLWITVDGLVFMGYQFLWFSWRVRSTNSSTHEIAILCMNYEGKYYGHEFWTPRMWEFCSIHKNWYPRNKGIHSTVYTVLHV